MKSVHREHACVLLAATSAAVSTWIAFATTHGGGMILLALPCLFALSNVASARLAFYVGLVTGVAMYAPLLMFFYTVFGRAAVAIDLIAGLPIAVFVLLSYQVRRLFHGPLLALAISVLWTGVEYFRSELYSLRFAWLLPGQSVAFLPGVRLLWLGVYGLGFVMALGAAMLIHRGWMRVGGSIVTTSILIAMYIPSGAAPPADAPLQVAGVQLEFPTDQQAVDALEHLAIANPNAQLLVLSEYSFDGAVPEVVRQVLRKHRRYLIAGGTRSLDNGDYYDTAYVVGPDGSDIFQQAKSVPVQFMADGLPAKSRNVWHSPWGKIGIAICYDLSYSRVMDDFVRQGARGLIIPTEDGQKWGAFERRMLHGRMAPIRSAEYGIPTFGVWSSGVSQLTDRSGRVIATAGFPGQGDELAGPFDLRQGGHVPPDRRLALACSVATGGFALYWIGFRIMRRKTLRIGSGCATSAQ